VNWLYGAYIPKDAPIVALDGNERYRLFTRQSFTTPGIYIKTGFFAIHDQVRDSPPELGDGFEGFAERVGYTTDTISSAKLIHVAGKCDGRVGASV
jgi:hypothetical protein